MDKIVYNTEGEWGNLVVQELKLPQTHMKPEVIEFYNNFGKRIHWIDTNVVPGAFQMNTSWYFQANKDLLLNATDSGITVNNEPHVHDSDEVLGFYGTDPENPSDLGGEVELMINGEMHVLTKSSLIFLPAGMPHCPLFLTRVDRPIFHFSIVMNPQYTMTKDGEHKVAE